MAIEDDIRLALRDYKTVTATYPLGDPSSPVWNPPKKALRDALVPLGAEADALSASVVDAETSRAQAELAAIAAGATLYDSTADGLAETVSGDVFLVSTEPGVQVYRNDTTATFLGWLGRVEFDTFASFIASNTTFIAGTLVEVRDIQATYRAVAGTGTGNLGQANAGGQEFDVLLTVSTGYDPRAFGAVGDGTTDDTLILQRLGASGLPVLFPPLTFKVTDTIDITVAGVPWSSVHKPYFGDVAEIKLISATAKPVIKTTKEGITFTKLKVTGAGTAAGNIGIQLGTGSGTADIDSYITDCFVNTTQDSVVSYGRGIYIENSQLVATGNCWRVEWPDPFTAGSDSDQTAKTGMRAGYLRNCRLQAIAGAIVRNTGANAANFTGLTMSGNYVDGRNGVLQGSFRNATVAANTFIHSNSIMFLLDDVGGLAVTGNTFAGQFDDSGNVTTPHDADIQTIISLNTGFTAKGITFVGNRGINVYKSAFFLNGNWSDVNISNNGFDDILRGNNDAGLDPAQYSLVQINSPGEDLTVIGNHCGVGDYTRNGFLVSSGGNAVTNWQVHSNIFDATHIEEQNLGVTTPVLSDVTVPTYSLQKMATTRIGPLRHIDFKITVASGLDNADGSAISISAPFNVGVTPIPVMITMDQQNVSLLTSKDIAGARISGNVIQFFDISGNFITYTDCNQSGTLHGNLILKYAGA